MMRRKCLALLLAAAIPAAALAQQNPTGRRTAANVASLFGHWDGANLENRSNCVTAGVNGMHGTWAHYFFTVSGSTLSIAEETASNLTCNYSGNFTEDGLQVSWSGEFACSDNKRGTFQSQSFLILPTEMQVRLQMKLTSSEGCDIDSILGGSRF